MFDEPPNLSHLDSSASMISTRNKKEEKKVNMANMHVLLLDLHRQLSGGCQHEHDWTVSRFEVRLTGIKQMGGTDPSRRWCQSKRGGNHWIKVYAAHACNAKKCEP